MSLLTLQYLWFGLLGLLLTGWFVLDGSNLGVGLWHLLARPGTQRAQLLRTVAPFWDGHQVWLIAAVGASFAAFPPFYAALLSGLYPLLILLLIALALRTISVEYAQKEPNPHLRYAWDLAFAAGSAGAIVLSGLILGNVLRGLPLDRDHEVVLPRLHMLNAPALLVTALLLVTLATHGATWVTLKTGGAVRLRSRRWGLLSWAARLPLTALVVAILRTQPHLTANYAITPALWAVPVLALLSLVATGGAIRGGRDRAAFIASSISVVGLFATAGIAMFPNLLPALGASRQGLSVTNASSSELSLTIMLVAVLVGLPLVLAYTSWMFRLFGERAGETEGEYR